MLCPRRRTIGPSLNPDLKSKFSNIASQMNISLDWKEDVCVWIWSESGQAWIMVHDGKPCQPQSAVICWTKNLLKAENL